MESTRFVWNYFKNKSHRGPRDSFKLLQKQNTRGHRDSFKQLKKNTKNYRDCSKLFEKQNTRGSEILLNYFKRETYEIKEIFFKFLQKQDPQGFSSFFQICWKTTQKYPQDFTSKTNGLRDCFNKLVLKKQNTRVSKVLSSYFKSKTQGVPEILSNYFIKRT